MGELISPLDVLILKFHLFLVAIQIIGVRIISFIQKR